MDDAKGPIKRAIIEVVVIRADGTREELADGARTPGSGGASVRAGCEHGGESEQANRRMN